MGLLKKWPNEKEWAYYECKNRYIIQANDSKKWQSILIYHLHKQLPAGIVLCAFKLTMSPFCFLIIKVKDGKWLMAFYQQTTWTLVKLPSSYTICRQFFGTAEQEIALIFPVLAPLCTMHTPFALKAQSLK